MGSSSYITDRNGEVIQHTEYIAFGEVLVDEHSVSNKQPYLFNGKELDFETGLYYYGARYYDPKTSIFLNVDPLAEKTLDPYGYVWNNPIRFIDPTGMQGEDPKGKIYEAKEPIKEIVIVGKARPKVQTRSSSLFYRNWSHKQQANIDAARARFGKAEAQCNICQEVKSIERFMFLYMPMTIATGGLNVKGTAMFYAGKAAISIGTQGIMNLEKDINGNWGSSINIMKVAGDTFFTPISGSILGNSSEISIGIGKDRENIYRIHNQDKLMIEAGVDLLFMKRSKFYERNGTGKIGETILEIQSQIMTQGISKGIDK